MKQGIEIWMHKLKSVIIADDGHTVTFGGGILSKEVTDALWKHNKQTGGNEYKSRCVILTTALTKK